MRRHESETWILQRILRYMWMLRYGSGDMDLAEDPEIHMDGEPWIQRLGCCRGAWDTKMLRHESEDVDLVEDPYWWTLRHESETWLLERIWDTKCTEHTDICLVNNFHAICWEADVKDPLLMSSCTLFGVACRYNLVCFPGACYRILACFSHTWAETIWDKTFPRDRFPARIKSQKPSVLDPTLFSWQAFRWPKKMQQTLASRIPAEGCADSPRKSQKKNLQFLTFDSRGAPRTVVATTTLRWNKYRKKSEREKGREERKKKDRERRYEDDDDDGGVMMMMMMRWWWWWWWRYDDDDDDDDDDDGMMMMMMMIMIWWWYGDDEKETNTEGYF